MADLAPLRRRVAARQGVVTRRESALAELQGQRRRARSPARRRDLDGQVEEARRALAADRRALAALRRELRELREEPEAIGPEAMVEEALPFDAPPPPPPSDPYEGRVLSEGGGVGALPSGLSHGLIWVPEARRPMDLDQWDPDTDTYTTTVGIVADHSAEAWTAQLESLLTRLAPHPDAWAGRLRIQLAWYDPEGGSGGGGPGADDSDAYEVGDASAPPAGVGYFPAGGSLREGGGTSRTLTGWTRTPGKLLEILDLAGERLIDDDWEIVDVVLELLWIPGAPGPLPGPLPKGEVTE